MAEAKDQELDRLLAAFVDQRATPEQVAQLESFLDGDPKALRRYVHYLDLHAELKERHLSPIDPAGTLPTRSLTPRWWVWLIMATAAAILIATGVWIGSFWHAAERPIEKQIAEERTDDGVAVLALASDARWASEKPPQTGSILSPGPLKLLSGLIQIEFYSGASLILEGPAELEIVSADQAICRSGKLRASVPPPARGFVIRSPQFDLVDLGTEFGLEVDRDGPSKVHVFNGKVELYPPGERSQNEVRRLVGGEGIRYEKTGERSTLTSQSDAFLLMEVVRARQKTAVEQRLKAWRKWNESIKKDPRVAFHFDFESEGPHLFDRGPSASHGTIVGAERASGRWPGKHALEFTRPSDRVLLNLPGSYDQLTLTAWLRVDALPDRPQGILLTDGYEIDRPHWQISDAGTLRLGVRIPSTTKIGATGYGSPVLFTPRNMGLWCFLASVYDRKANRVSHFFNGEEVSTDQLIGNQPLSLGPCEIGNWGMPFRSKTHVIRNFVGRIDELTLWNVALKSEEIRSHFLEWKP